MNEEKLKQIIINSDNRNKNIIGSSTLCTAFIDDEHNMLYTAYIGDSVFMILRKNDKDEYYCLKKAEEMVHSFNFPYQLGTNGDNPNQTSVRKWDLEKEDIVILASDG